MVAAIVVPVLLLSLLIVPRWMGLSLFPVGVPLLGADPTATVSITPQVKNLSDTYSLTASLQVSKPDVTTREITARSVPGFATDRRSAQHTGSTYISHDTAIGSNNSDN